MSNTMPAVRIATDVGGTFTDLVILQPDGRIATRKVPSTPPDFERGTLDAIDAILSEEAIDPESVSLVTHGTTVATNTVLERRGARAALITTRGFRDVLELRRTRAPQLYDLFFTKPAPLIERFLRFELAERVAADGKELAPVDENELDMIAEAMEREQVESIAVCFLHGYAYPAHEQEVGAYLSRRFPGLPVSLSHDVLRQRREYERTATTSVNAYVRPVMRRYIDRLQGGLSTRGLDAPLQIMQSAGGLTSAEHAAALPVFALESGPAAGVLAAAAVARAADLQNVISFDMGGTTAKAAMIEGGEIPHSTEYEVGSTLSAGNRLTGGGGELILVPSIDIAEVGAGGGSMATVDAAGRLRVGPQSAGALPGPACYGLGGTEPTVTDANVVLGYIAGGDLAGGDISIDAGVAHDVIQETIATPLQLNVTDAALGIHRIANANMLRALREVSVYRGRDPREFALVAFGGCGPVHACLLAAELGTQRVLIPPVPGLFSAIGLLVSGIEHHDVRSCRLAAEQGASASISTLVDEMRTPMLDQFHEESVPRESVSLRVACDVRYTGEISEIRVQADDDQTTPERVQQIREAFEAEHIRLYGHGGNPGSTIEIVAVRLVGRTAGDDSIARGGARSGTATGTRSAVFGERWGAIEAPIINRNDLGEGRKGPFLIDEYDATIVIPPNWRGATDTTGNIILELNDGKD